jgi:hypothetical protein
VRRSFLFAPIAAWSFFLLFAPVVAKTVLVYKGVETRIAAWDCGGIYCYRSICVSLENVSDRQPGTARFYIEGLWGKPRDLDVHTGKYCVEKGGVGFVAFTVIITPIEQDLYATTDDDLK